jgi:hypothetical protein
MAAGELGDAGEEGAAVALAGEDAVQVAVVDSQVRGGGAEGPAFAAQGREVARDGR